MRPQWHVWESRARQALIKTMVPPALAARRDSRSTNMPGAQQLDRLPVGLLPRPIGELFQVKGAPHPQHPMGELPVTALARGRQLAVEFAPPGLHLAAGAWRPSSASGLA